MDGALAWATMRLPALQRSRLLIILLLSLAGIGTIWQAVRWTGHNGDHFYYTTMALQFSGVPHPQAMSEAAAYFHYWQPAAKLEYGFQNPQIAPLIIPRTLLPLAAVPAIKLFGVAGIWMPGLLAGAATVVVVARTVDRRLGRAAVPALLLVLVMLRPFTEFGFGVYTDAPAILIMAGIFTLVPFGHLGPNRWRVVSVCLLIVLLTLTRQLGVVPHLLITAGFIAACFKDRTWRNDWFPFLLVLPVSAVCSVIMAKWAPYDVLAWVMFHTKTTSVLAALLHTPGQAWQALCTDFAHAAIVDLICYATVTALALVGLWRRRANPWSVAVIGATIGAAMIYLLDGRTNDFRYLTPVIPAVAFLATDTLSRLLHLDRTSTHLQPEAAAATSRGGADRLIALGVGTLTAIVVLATGLAYRPLPHRGEHSVTVSASSFGANWPLRVPVGRLVCAGDDEEVWFVAPNGKNYAFSGAAMSRSFLAPRLMSLAGASSMVGSTKRIAFPWPGAARLLEIGLAACRA